MDQQAPSEVLSQEIQDNVVRKKVLKTQKQSTSKGRTDQNKVEKRVNYAQDSEANEKIRKAIAALESKKTQLLLPNGKPKSIRNVREYFGVPKSTLSDRKTNRYSIENPPQLGRKSLFSDKDLEEIVSHLLKMAEIGYGYTPIQALNLVRFIAVKCKNKENFNPSRTFMANIYSKFPELSVRKITAYEYQRAKSLTPQIVQRFFAVMETAYSLSQDLSGVEINPRNIWSLDEVGFKLNNYENSFVVTRKGVKNAYRIIGDDSSHISIIFCTNACGYTLPPYFIIKGKKPNEAFIENCKKAGFRNSPIYSTDKAFITFSAFSNYCEFFIKEAKYNKDSYSILVLDGHKSHTYNLEALQFLNQNKIFAVCIPSHTSHIFNIADRTVFGNMKKFWREESINYTREKGKKITLTDFPFIFKEVWTKSVNQIGIIKGVFLLNISFKIIAFESAGIFPLDKNWLTKDKNQALFKLGSFGYLDHQSQADSNEKKFQNLVSKFNFQTHLGTLNHLDLHSPVHQEEVIHDYELKQEIKDLLHTKEEDFFLKVKENSSQSKRKNQTFEDLSQPRILNTSEQLDKLRERQENNPKEIKLSQTSLKKMKSNDENYLPEPKVPINLKGIPNRLKKESLLEGVITGIEGDPCLSEEFVSEDSSQSLHYLNLPISHETSSLVTKRNIVRQNLFDPVFNIYRP